MKLLSDLGEFKYGIEGSLVKPLEKAVVSLDEPGNPGTGSVTLTIVNASGDDQHLITIINLDVVPSIEPSTGVQVEYKVAIVHRGCAFEAIDKCLFIGQVIKGIEGGDDEAESIVHTEIDDISLDKSRLTSIDEVACVSFAWRSICSDPSMPTIR